MSYVRIPIRLAQPIHLRSTLAIKFTVPVLPVTAGVDILFEILATTIIE